MKKKNILALLTLSVAGIMGLASCGTVEARPQGDIENAPILNLDGVVNNTMEEIYDALVTPGTSNSEQVLNNVLYLYSTTIYGNFFDVGNVKGLRTVVENYLSTNDTAEIQAFADAYAVYHDAEGNGDINKVVSFYSEVLYRIRSVFLGYVSNADYTNNRSEFSERKFYEAQIGNYHSLAQEHDGIYPYNEDYTQIQGSFRLTEDIKEDEEGFILDGGNKDYDGDIKNAYFKDIFGTYQTYIEMEILPDIYRDELTSQYLYSQNFGQIRLTAARKIDYISLKDNASKPSAVRNLVDAYCEHVIEKGEDSSIYGFTFLDSLYKGTMDYFTEDQKAMAETILKDAQWTKDSIMVGEETIDFYQESKLGTDIERYRHISDSRFDDNTDIRNDYTNNGAYTIETGFLIKENALIAENNTNHGWFTSSTLTLGNDSLQNRLFRVQVANEVDSTEYDPNTGKYANDVASDHFEYGHYRGGSYYLTPASYQTGTDYPYAYYDDANDTFYIVRVDEAVKAAKITPPNANASASVKADYYDNMAAHEGDHNYAENVARKMAYLLASGDTWTQSSNSYYVEQMAIVYHDDYVFDYFKTTFPDLFD